MKMRTIIPGTIKTRDMHQYLIGSVAPRPIAFVSTLDEDGNSNLAPYSFFNIFSSNPPIIVFSANRRVRDNTTKDTLHNIRKTGEAVINMVSYDMVRQMAVASIEWPPGVSEFDKAGFNKLESDLVKPYRVKESFVHMECKLKDLIELGHEGGSGHLIICDILRIHIAEKVIDENGRIDPHKIDLMGRMGRAYYARASGDAVKTIVQPVTKLTVGYDNLPEHVRMSNVLTGNDIGLLAGIENWPSIEEIKEFIKTDSVLPNLHIKEDHKRAYYDYAKELLSTGDLHKAAMVMGSIDIIFSASS